MLKPLIPIISDTSSHIFNEMAHIATVHAIYGSNHLATELADTGRDDTSKKHDTPKSVSEVPYLLQQKDIFIIFIFTNQIINFLFLRFLAERMEVAVPCY